MIIMNTMTSATLEKGKRGRRSGLVASENRQRILDAALSCFARLGYKNTSNDAIAREAGLTAAAIYNHFKSKSELYISVFEHAETAIGQMYRDVENSGGTAREAIEAFFHRAEDLYMDDPDIARFLSQVSLEVFHNTELAMPLAEKVKGEVETVLKGIIVNGQKTGEIAAGIDPDPLVELHVNAQLGIAQVSLFYGADYYKKGMHNLKNHILQLMFGDKPDLQNSNNQNNKRTI